LKVRKEPDVDESYVMRSFISPSIMTVIKSTRMGRMGNVSHMKWIRNKWGFARKIWREDST
jgi:hypothetical protein